MAATRELPLSGQPYLTPTLRYDDYTIGWICALDVETEAAMYMLDTRHRGVFPFIHGDDNQYIPGEIAGHKVVIVCLPRGSQGSVSAATLVTQMRQSFKRLQYGLMVGIGGGVPGRDLNPDIRLGDVVVARSSDKSISPPGVIGYELGAETVEGFSLRDWQAPTHPRLRNAIEYIERDTEVEGTLEFLHHLEIFPTRINGKQFLHPGAEQDQLYEGDHVSNLVQRQPRGSQDPVVHYGLIASGNKLVKNAELRDKLRDKYGIICFEMEAAGIMNTLPVAVIRGICDYADSRKNDKWRRYAAATAAAYAKALLKTLPALEASASIACGTSYSQLHDLKQSFFQWPRNSYFSGREEELRKIKTELSRDKPRNQQGPLRFAIYGLGGVGKTQLVIEYCHRVREKRPHTSIFWYKVSGPEGLTSQYQNHAQLLRGFARSYSDERITNIANHYRHTGMEVCMIKAWIAQEEDWLLVMDGFDEVVDADGVPVNLEEFIPTDPKGKVIFTSRDKRLIGIAKAHLELELKEPSPLDAVRLFVRLRHKDDVLLENLDSSDRSQIEQIVDNLKKFPLALSQAVAYIRRLDGLITYTESLSLRRAYTWEKITKWLKRTLRSFPSISSWTPERVVFIVVFVSLVVAIVDLHLEDMPQKWKDKVPKRRAKVLWHLLSFLSRNNESKQDEVLFLQGIVTIQLSLSLSAEKYLTLSPPFLIEDFCPSYFKYLGIRSIAAYFNQCAAFHGPSSPTEDPHRLAGAVQFFANLFKLWYKKEEDNIKIDTSNSCGHISNAFGGGPSDFRDNVSLAPEMPTLWRAVLPCVDALLERQHSGTTKDVKRAHYLLDTVVEILRLANRSQYHATPILQREINRRYGNIYATQGSYRPRPALKALQDIF